MAATLFANLYDENNPDAHCTQRKRYRKYMIVIRSNKILATWDTINRVVFRYKRTRPTRGLCAFIFIFLREDAPPDVLMHEKIHVLQQLELLFIGQWIMYIGNNIVNLFRYKTTYLIHVNNVFEREAIANQKNADYLRARKFWAWTQYFK